MHARIFSIILIAFMPFANSASLRAEAKPLDKVTLKPGEEKIFSIPSTVPVKVGFTTELEMEQMQKCAHHGIQLSAPALGDMQTASPLGTSIEVPAKDGQVTFVLKNMEAFPISLETSRE